MNAGFFSYILFNTNYQAWQNSVSPYYKDGIELGENTPFESYDDLVADDAKHSHRFYVMMMRAFAGLFVLTMFYYWYTVYECYQWKFEIETDTEGKVIPIEEEADKPAVPKKDIKDKFKAGKSKKHKQK